MNPSNGETTIKVFNDLSDEACRAIAEAFIMGDFGPSDREHMVLQLRDLIEAPRALDVEPENEDAIREAIRFISEGGATRSDHRGGI